MVEVYAAFFRDYTNFVADQNIHNRGRVIASLEIARLLMPAEIVVLLQEFEQSFLSEPHNISSRAKLLDELRKAAYDHISAF